MDIDIAVSEREQMIAGLTKLRLDWEGAANGRSLFDVKGNVAFMLADFANLMNLSQDEKLLALGEITRHIH